MLEFTALADPTRRRIVELLAGGERAAGDIAGRFQATPSAISQHLKMLREAQLVRVRIEGQRRIYSLDPAGFTAIDRWLASTRLAWLERLDRLERELVGQASSGGWPETLAKGPEDSGRKPQ